MKRFLNSFVAIIGIVLMTALSCTKELADATDLKNEKHTCTMRLVGSFVDYDALNTKAETNTTSWVDGSTIYLRMSSPLGWTTGEAIYNAAKDVWTISYYGSLYEGASNTCTAIYLEDKVSYENSLFTLDEGTVIYEDLTGSYIFEGGDLVEEGALGTEIQCQLIFIRCLVRRIQVDDLGLRKGKQAAGTVIFSCAVCVGVAVLKHTKNDILILSHLLPSSCSQQCFPGDNLCQTDR